jgi:hypothetical protein
MLYLPDRLTLWLSWVLLASAVFTAIPLGPFGLLGWMGAAGPLLHRAFPDIGAKRMAVLGLAVIGAMVFLADGLNWYEVFVPPLVFLFGLLLAPVPITGYRDPERDTSAADAEHFFRLALAREVGRSRRHERPLTLISAACENDHDIHELEAAIASQVHIYAQTFPVDGRLMVIVPELDEAAYKSLEARILKAAEDRYLHSVALGVATFPSGECTASGMVEVADSSRRMFTLGRGKTRAVVDEESAEPLGNGQTL